MIRKHLSYANVASTLAMVLALSGVSYAAAALPRNSVGTAQLQKAAVTTAKLDGNAVTSPRVKNGSLRAVDFRDGELRVPGYERIQTTVNVTLGQTFIIASAACPDGKKLLGGGYAVQDSKFHVTYALAQQNDVYGLTATLLPGQTVTANSQAFVIAICGLVEAP